MFLVVLGVFLAKMLDAQCISQFTFSPNDTACVAQPVIITLANAGVTSVTWSGGDLTSPQNTSAINVAAIVSQSYIVNWTDGICNVTDTVRLTTTPVRAVFHNKTDPNCGKNNGTINCSASGNSMRFTFLRNGVFYSDGATQISNLPAGNYSFAVYDLVTGCSDTIHNIILTDNTTYPEFTAVQTTSVACYGNTTGTISVTVTGGTGNYTYNWNYDPTNHANVATGLTSGTVYSVTVSDGVCSPIDTTVVLSGPSDSLKVTLTASPDHCQQGIGYTIALAAGGTVPYQYVWANSTVTSDTLSDILGPERITLTVTDANGCQTTATDTILNTGTPEFEITKIDSTCANGSQGAIALRPISNDGPFTYNWSFDTSFHGASATGLAAGDYVVSAYNSMNCPQVFHISVPTYIGSTFNLGRNQTIVYGATTNIEIETDAAVTNIRWSPANVSRSDEGLYYVSPKDTITYYAVATYGQGCTLADSVTIYVKHDPVKMDVPNIFTPNGDGINDDFYVQHSGIRTFQIWIYDRWGKEIFESTDVDFRWNGTDMYSGAYVMDGTYAYLIKYDLLRNPQENKIVKGFVSVVK